MTRGTSTLVALCLALGACRPTPRPIPANEVTSSPSDAAPSLDARWLRDTSRAALGAGAGPLHVVGFGAGVPGDSIDGFVFVEEGKCLLTYARGPVSVEDLDLLAFGDDGTPFGSDESPDDLPTLMLCPDGPTRIYLAARVAQGQGLVALGAQLLPRAAAEDVSRAVGARHAKTAVHEPNGAWPGLDSAVARHRDALGGEWIDQRRVAVPLDARVPTVLTADVPAGGCLDVLLLPSADVSQVQLSARDEHGRVFARAHASQRRSSLVLCSEKGDQEVAFDMRPYAGRGLAVAVLSVTRPGFTSHDLQLPVTQIGPAAAASESPPKSLPAPRETHRFELALGEIKSATTTLNGCARLDAVAGERLRGGVLRVWSEQGALLTETRVTHQSVPAFVCTTGPLRLDAEATEFEGKLEVALRLEQEKVQNQLLSNPLAAGRLLLEAQQAGNLSMPHDIGEVNVKPIRTDQLARETLSIPSSHCRTIHAAKGSGGWGIEGRLIDSQSRLQLDLARGAGGITLRACAGRGSHLDATLELRTVRGQSTALWSSRQEKLD